MLNLETKIGSLELENPVIVASGYTADTGKAILKLEKYQPGAIVLKSSLLDEEYGLLTRPYARHRFPSIRNRFHIFEGTFVFGETMSTMSLESWADWLVQNKRHIRTPLIASVVGLSVEGRVKAARLMEQAGADAVEISFGCPAPYFQPFPYGVSRDPEIIGEVCAAVKKAIDIPVLVKAVSHPVAIARAAYEAGADCVTLRGAPIPAAPDIDLNTVKPLAPYVFAAAGVPAQVFSLYHALYLLRDLNKTVHFSANGGIMQWQDLAKLVLYGAGSIQVQSAVLLSGGAVIKKMKDGLTDYMAEKGFPDLAAMKGAIISELPEYQQVLDDYVRTKGKIVAFIDTEKCVNCGFCEEICSYSAISLAKECNSVIKELCEGCGLCRIKCPVGAIRLENN
jgi:dihydroorotate dehydrogenase/Pyruvate/2-oxoacid:ferredoxin oxidoreductase delta subunit